MANIIKTDKTGQHCMVRADINNHSVFVECKCLGIKPSYGSVDYILEPVLNPGETISVRDRIVKWLPLPSWDETTSKESPIEHGPTHLGVAIEAIQAMSDHLAEDNSEEPSAQEIVDTFMARRNHE